MRARSVGLKRAALVFPDGVVLAAIILAASSVSAVQTPGVVRYEFPLDDRERSYAAEAGNTPPAHAMVTIVAPPGFVPTKTSPVLILSGTSDFGRRNSDDIPFYAAAARSEKWLVLTGDAPTKPRQDSTGWRFAMTLAAVRALHAKFPGSERWPVACAGYSGGAKRAGFIAPLLKLAGCRLAGIFLTGINEDRLSTGYRQYLGADAGFRELPIFVSSGQTDQVAPPAAQSAVVASLKRNGFSRVREESFEGGHVVNSAHVRGALAWFRNQR